MEGLRGLAAAAVLVGHVHLYGSPSDPYALGPADPLLRTCGTVGVVLFFTLSGFLLYRPFAAALLDGRPAPSVRAYLRNRFLRILPAYWLAVLGTGLVLRATYLPAGEVTGRSLASEPGVLALNLLMVQNYLPSTMLTGIGPAWSLHVEMAFYLVLPLLAGGAGLLATRTSLGRGLPWLAALAPSGLLLVGGQLGVKLAYTFPSGDGGTWAGSWHAVLVRSLVAQASLFAAGMLLAVVHTQVSRGVLRLPSWWRAGAALGAMGLGVPAVLAFDSGRMSENRATLIVSWACALLLALVVLPATRRRSPLLAVLASRPLQWSGLVSYGVFLWHDPIVWLLRREGLTTTGRAGFVLALLATVGLAGLAAALSWRFVERPALSLKRSVAAPGPAVAVPQQAPPVLDDPEPAPAREQPPLRRGRAGRPR